VAVKWESELILGFLLIISSRSADPAAFAATPFSSLSVSRASWATVTLPAVLAAICGASAINEAIAAVIVME
jgi:hypothetical protein